MMTLYQPEISSRAGGLGGTRRGSSLGLPGGVYEGIIGFHSMENSEIHSNERK